VGTAAEVITLLQATVNELRRGEIEVSIANAIAILASTTLKALQRNDLDQRVARLESILDRQQASYGADSEVEFVNSGR
jgi:hypothetical protein